MPSVGQNQGERVDAGVDRTGNVGKDQGACGLVDPATNIFVNTLPGTYVSDLIKVSPPKKRA